MYDYHVLGPLGTLGLMFQAPLSRLRMECPSFPGAASGVALLVFSAPARFTKEN